MAIIRRLDSNTVNQISAGEVVERPSSIVKELVENAIDADASAITIEIENGGMSLIRVTDNGIGMDKEDAKASFQRHATSKIAAADDLNSIHTLGFRGEALASIAAVTQMEMLTRPRDSISGYHIKNHGGQLIQASDTGCPEGTTIITRNLFYNTPARLKFLKAPRSETANISELAGKLILSNPFVSIKYINNGKTIYHSSGNGNLLSAILCIYGKDTKGELILVEDDFGNDFSLYGYVGKPCLSRTNRIHQSFFVNNRYVRSQLLSQNVGEALKDWTMINHFPWCVLNIKISPKEIDVNVHPSKTEIRFRNPGEVTRLLRDSIRTIYSSSSTLTGTVNLNTKREPVQYKSEQIEYFDNNRLVKDKLPEISTEIKEDPSNAKVVYIQQESPEKNPDYTGMNWKKDDNTNYIDIDEDGLKKWNIIGTAFSTYILIETDSHLLIVDQHAAHERLIYEQLKESILNQSVLSQQLSPSYILEVTHDEFIYITDNIESFLSVGFEIEPFGGKSFIIRGIPMVLKEINIKELFHELLDLSSRNIGEKRLALHENDIIMMACKKAVKAHDKLSQQEIRSLLKDIVQKKIPLTCPHGRPIFISISRYELEKKFKRIQ